VLLVSEKFFSIKYQTGELGSEERMNVFKEWFSTIFV